MAQASAPNFRALPPSARAFLPTLFLTAAGALVLAERSAINDGDLDVALLVTATLLCAGGNLFEVFAPGHFSFQPNLVFFFAASLMLPPWAVGTLAVVCFAPGWVMHHFRWYMVSFNVANYVLAGLAAQAIAVHAGALDGTTDGSRALALVAATAVFVLLNHGLIALVVSFARGRSLGSSARAMLDCIPVDTALGVTGACIAVLWTENPAVAALVAGPMLLMYRGLWVPLLEHKSRTDPKTGLYNSEYLQTEFEDALAAAGRRGEQVSIVMIDLDQLRAVNNLHGHLAGDKLIRGVADILRELASTDGVASRFGGDELCLLLPNACADYAYAIAEQIRAAVDELELSLSEAPGALTATVSVGVATYPEHGTTAEQLLEAADAAVYDAKLGGRNRIRAAVPEAVRALLDVPERPGTPPWTVNGNGRMDPALPELHDAPAAKPAAAEPSPATKRRIAAYIAVIGLLAAGSVALGAFGVVTGVTSPTESPLLFGLVIVSFFMLDFVRIDVFERAAVSPACVPGLVLAYFFGPVGVVFGELAIAAGRVLRRDALLKWSFDLVTLTLSGAVAAAVFWALPDGSSGAIILAAAAAALVYYVVNTPLLAQVMALAEGQPTVRVWRERLSWLLPHYVAFGLLAGTFVVSEQEMGLFAFVVFGLPVLMLWVAQKQYLDRSRNSVAELRQSHGELEATNARLREALDENRALLAKMHRSYLSTITSLARTIEAKDPYTGGHTERVADLCALLAVRLGFSEADLRAVRVGALIHDIGKIGVPDGILLKKDRLDDLERIEIKRHPEISSYILAELDLPAVVKQMVRSHHERWDGGGYPDGLQANEIPLAARILAVADALDAMTTDRPYRKAIPLAEALAEVREQAGHQFCPTVAQVLVDCVQSSLLGDVVGLQDVPNAADAVLELSR